MLVAPVAVVLAVVEELGAKEAPLPIAVEPPITPPLEVMDASRGGARPMSLSLVEPGKPLPFAPKGWVPETGDNASGLNSSDWLDACPGFRFELAKEE